MAAGSVRSAPGRPRPRLPHPRPIECRCRAARRASRTVARSVGFRGLFVVQRPQESGLDHPQQLRLHAAIELGDLVEVRGAAASARRRLRAPCRGHGGRLAAMFVGRARGSVVDVVADSPRSLSVDRSAGRAWFGRRGGWPTFVSLVGDLAQGVSFSHAFLGRYAGNAVARCGAVRCAGRL